MTKEEFMEFSYDAQHNMVLEALVRITKNLEIMEEVSGKPFVGTTKQRRNDIKLLTILADAFSKNELAWKSLPESMRQCLDVKALLLKFPQLASENFEEE